MGKLPEGWKYYLFSYPFNGSRYSFEIPAKSEKEARERLLALSCWATYDGEVHAIIPAVPGAGLFVRFMCWWKARFSETPNAQD